MPSLPATADRFRGVTEAEFQRAIEDLLKLGGWAYIHFTDSRRQNAEGFPDLFAVHPATGRRLAAELKSESGRLSVAQKRWLMALSRCGVETYLWRPSQKAEVVKVLLEGTHL